MTFISWYALSAAHALALCADSCSSQVENYIFRVHRYFFERESAYFREKFAVAAPPGQPPRGSSDANAFPLEDVLANDFSRFLWVFYNP